MSQTVKIEKTIYSLQGFNKAVNTNFNQLISPSLANDESLNVSLESFFEQYDLLYFDIPLSGSEQSHLGLAARSLEAVGLSLEDLQNEISELREENINLKNQLLLVTKVDIGTLKV
jgi:hypothetical protein